MNKTREFIGFSMNFTISFYVIQLDVMSVPFMSTVTDHDFFSSYAKKVIQRILNPVSSNTKLLKTTNICLKLSILLAHLGLKAHR